MKNKLWEKSSKNALGFMPKAYNRLFGLSSKKYKIFPRLFPTPHIYGTEPALSRRERALPPDISEELDDDFERMFCYTEVCVELFERTHKT